MTKKKRELTVSDAVRILRENKNLKISEEYKTITISEPVGMGTLSIIDFLTCKTNEKDHKWRLGAV